MAVDSKDMSYLAEFLKKECAVVLDEDKGYLVNSRLTPLARKRGDKSAKDVINTLRKGENPSVAPQIIDAMTTHETSFYRDGYPFEVLKEKLLPDAIKRNEAKRELTIWCGAASFGQEPYTIAMVIRDHFPKLASWTVRIVATDVSEPAIARASEGLYSALEVKRGLDEAQIRRHFTKEGKSYRVRPELRKLIKFEVANLIGRWPFMARVDLVFMRNVLIYFDADTKREILEKVRKVMHPEGILFLGAAESASLIHQSYKPERIGRACVYGVGK